MALVRLMPPYPLRVSMASPRGIGRPLKRTVPVVSGNHRRLKRIGGCIHHTGGKASTALGRAGDLVWHHGYVHLSLLGRNLASNGSEEGALLGAGIGYG